MKYATNEKVTKRKVKTTTKLWMEQEQKRSDKKYENAKSVKTKK